MANAKVKTAVAPLIRFKDRGRALRSVRSARINCRRNLPPLTNRPHHGGWPPAATQLLPGHHHGVETGGPWQAVTFACPRRPLRVRLQRLKKCARGARLQSRLRAINGPDPYHVRKTLERREPLA
jgi:hypothetical protein